MSAIKSPTLLLDEQKVRANIERMVTKADDNGLTLKPHFKTHQSVHVGDWFKEFGITKATVSSLKMAEYFAGAGWNDLTIAFPVNLLEINRIDALANAVHLSVLISDPNVIPAMENSLNNDLGVYIEVDTGSNRTGFLPEETQEISQVLRSLKNHPDLHFKGFYSHPGHSYSANGKEQVQAIHQDAVQKMRMLKHEFNDEYPGLVCCIGDTPCCSLGEDWKGIDELSPGNFVFYDLVQAGIGACTIEDIAVAMACPVVATYPERNEIVVHGGAIHLSKDSLTDNGALCFGQAVRLNDDNTWETEVGKSSVRSVSQEHGIIKCSPDFVDHIKIGDLIGILPVHSCLTADTMKGYITCRSQRNIDHLQSAH